MRTNTLLKNLIYKQYVSEDMQKKVLKISKGHEKELNFAPSYLTNCARQIYYRKKKIDKTNPSTEASYLKRDMGNTIHKMFQDMFAEMGILKDCEKFKEYVYDGLKFIYRLDGELEIAGKEFILELKTVYGGGARTCKIEPRESDFWQAIMYNLFESKPVILLYVCVDTGYIIPPYYIDHLDIDRVELTKKIDRLHHIKRCLEQDIMPERDYEIFMKKYNDELSFVFTKDKKKYTSAYQCRDYCSWRDLCWKNEIESFKNSDKTFYIGGENL